MLSTDLRIVAESARIMTGFARIGLHPGGGHFQLLGPRSWS
jgi:enoyl-CoA hydratase